MAKLFVIPGHGAGDPGAGGYGYNEAERVRTLAARMKELAPNDVDLADFNRNYYADGGVNRLNLPKETMVLELHMDSADAQSARGGHVIIKDGFTPDSFDNALARNIAAMFPGRSQSIVRRSNLANINRAAARGINYRLLETCFISNQGDLNKFNSNLDDVARTILDAAGIRLGAPVQPDPEPAVNIVKCEYSNNAAQMWWIRGDISDGSEICIRNDWNQWWLSDPNSSQTTVNAQTWPGGNGNQDPREPQRMRLEASKTRGFWRIHPVVAPHLSLDAQYNDPSVGTQIQWYESNESEAQDFFFEEVTPGKHRIVSRGGFRPIGVV